MKTTEIPEVPENEIVLNDDGFINLANWIARYDKLKHFNVQESSPEICKLLSDGTLAKFNPDLAHYVGKDLSPNASEEEYEKYEFCVSIHIADTKNDPIGDGYVVLFFSFMNEKCHIYDCGNGNKAYELAESIFNQFNIDDEPMDISWIETDQLIQKLHHYLNAGHIPKSPDEQEKDYDQIVYENWKKNHAEELKVQGKLEINTRYNHIIDVDITKEAIGNLGFGELEHGNNILFKLGSGKTVRGAVMGVHNYVEYNGHEYDELVLYCLSTDGYEHFHGKCFSVKPSEKDAISLDPNFLKK